jgi:hypothetical protein
MALFLLLILVVISRLERVTWFGRKSMLRADVNKLQRRRLFRTPILVSRRSLFEDIRMPSGFEADAAWKAWMAVAQHGDAAQTSDALNAGQRS